MEAFREVMNKKERDKSQVASKASSFETTVVENSPEKPVSSLHRHQRCCFFGTLQVAIKDKE
jgi:hypothetical protein